MIELPQSCDRLLSAKQVGDLLGVSVRTIYRRKLPQVRWTGSSLVRFRLSDIRKIMDGDGRVARLPSGSERQRTIAALVEMARSFGHQPGGPMGETTPEHLMYLYYQNFGRVVASAMARDAIQAMKWDAETPSV